MQKKQKIKDNPNGSARLSGQRTGSLRFASLCQIKSNDSFLLYSALHLERLAPGPHKKGVKKI